ncbi:MAG: hypothetical protein M1823_005219 [Watsoniomyces obsoletus]|nr:MAG: hypothetical protein M1823_005219 [Watsoniomyces obsoletus]
MDIAPDQNQPQGPVVLSDVIGIERSINIFAGLTRDLSSISDRFDDESKHTTVLAPRNSVIAAVGHRPWEDPADYDEMGEQAYDGPDGKDRANGNLRKFVQAHLVPVVPWKEGEKVTTLAGRELYWETKGGKRIIQPGDIEVARVDKHVTNGEVWILNGVMDSS